MTSLDDTTFNVPDSAANFAAYTRPVTEARQGPYPQVRLLALVECGTLAVIAAVFDSLAIGERTSAARLLPMIERGTLLLADRGFPSYDLFTAAAGRGAELLWRVSASFTLPVIKVRAAQSTVGADFPPSTPDRQDPRHRRRPDPHRHPDPAGLLST